MTPGSAAEQCGLKEGSELLEVRLSAESMASVHVHLSSRPLCLQLERVLFGGGSVLLGQCTAEVAHFSLQWWTEPSTLKHRSSPEGESVSARHTRPTRRRFLPDPRFLSSAYSKLCSELSSPTFVGPDSFYVRVNLNMEPHGDPPTLAVSCDDIVHVSDTRYNGKYQWCCSLMDPSTAKPRQTGTMPSYNRCVRTSGSGLVEPL